VCLQRNHFIERINKRESEGRLLRKVLNNRLGGMCVGSTFTTVSVYTHTHTGVRLGAREHEGRKRDVLCERLYRRHTEKLIKSERFIKLRFGMQRNYSSEKIIKLI